MIPNPNELRELADRLSEHAEHHDYIRANDDEQAQWADDLTATAAYLREQADRMEQEAVAWVPVHPQHGPLWANATAEPNRERLPSYPLQAVYFHPAAPSPTCIGSDPACPCQDGDACHYRDAADGTKGISMPAQADAVEALRELVAVKKQPFADIREWESYTDRYAQAWRRADAVIAAMDKEKQE